jgi:hypothetical protein
VERFKFNYGVRGAATKLLNWAAFQMIFRYKFSSLLGSGRFLSFFSRREQFFLCSSPLANDDEISSINSEVFLQQPREKKNLLLFPKLQSKFKANESQRRTDNEKHIQTPTTGNLKFKFLQRKISLCHSKSFPLLFAVQSQSSLAGSDNKQTTTPRVSGIKYIKQPRKRERERRIPRGYAGKHL